MVKNVQNVAPVLHDEHVSLIHDQHFNGSQKIHVPAFLPFSADFDSKPHGRGNYDVTGIQVGEELKIRKEIEGNRETAVRGVTRPSTVI